MAKPAPDCKLLFFPSLCTGSAAKRKYPESLFLKRRKEEETKTAIMNKRKKEEKAGKKSEVKKGKKATRIEC